MIGLTRVQTGVPWEVAMDCCFLDQAVSTCSSFGLSFTRGICHRDKRGFLRVDLLPYSFLSCDLSHDDKPTELLEGEFCQVLMEGEISCAAANANPVVVGGLLLHMEPSGQSSLCLSLSQSMQQCCCTGPSWWACTARSTPALRSQRP